MRNSATIDAPSLSLHVLQLDVACTLRPRRGAGSLNLSGSLTLTGAISDIAMPLEFAGKHRGILKGPCAERRHAPPHFFFSDKFQGSGACMITENTEASEVAVSRAGIRLSRFFATQPL
jgi:hypothetical protein